MSKSQIAAAAIVVVFIIIGYQLDDITVHWASRLVPTLVIGFFLIQFPEELGSVTGMRFRSGAIDKESPGCVLVALGWAAIVGVPIFYFAVIRGSGM